MSYDRSCGRLSLSVNPYRGEYHAATLRCVSGWNDSCPKVEMILSLEELHDLRHLIDRALAIATPEQAPSR